MAISRHHLISRPGLFCAVVLATVGWTTAVGASESDLATVIEVPAVACPHGVVTVAVGYANLGPDSAATAYVNVTIPSGVPAPIDELTPEQFDDLQASAAGTDTLGNSPVLFLDAYGCEHLLFQLQGPAPPGPIQGLAPSADGSFTFDLEAPREPAIGHLRITEPAALAGEFVPALTRHRRLFDDGPTRRYGRGLNCNAEYGGCTQIGDCFGARLSLIPAFAADLAIVDDGGGYGDSSLGCGPLHDFPVGHVAVTSRGVCSFFVKAYYAEAAGAAAVIVVNDGQCETGETSAYCVVNMNGGALAGEVDIPVIMLSAADGGAIIETLRSGETVRATLGATSEAGLELTAEAFLVNPLEVDPDPGNDGAAGRLMIGMFADGFECGDMTGWSKAMP